MKHSLPDIVPDLPPEEWHLGPLGRKRCEDLARRLAKFHSGTIATSPEPKAVDTARIVSSRLGMPFETIAELHEHRRRVAKLDAQIEFEGQIKRLFDLPDQPVYGEETADQAHGRFADAVYSLVARKPEGDLMVIAHGTVISLFVSRTCGVDAFTLWKRLGLPSYVVLDLPGYDLDTVVDQA